MFVQCTNMKESVCPPGSPRCGHGPSGPCPWHLRVISDGRFGRGEWGHQDARSGDWSQLGGPMSRSAPARRQAWAVVALTAGLLVTVPPGPAALGADDTCVGKGEYGAIANGMSIQQLDQGAARPGAVRRDRGQGQAALPLVRRVRGLEARPRRLRPLPPARGGPADGQQEGLGRLRRPRRSAVRGGSGSRRPWASRARCARTARCGDRPW